jgi:phosphate uptake regulator
MEIRRVQMTGGSSYVVTLPKDWIKSLKVKKNDPLGLLMQSDGTLLVTTKMTQDKTHRIKEFDVNDTTNQIYLLRRLIGAYISGYTSIKIKSSKRMPPPMRVIIRKFTQTTIGQEIVEETDTTITLKDLLNPTEMPFDKTIRRMHIIVKSMHEDVMRALEENDRKLAEDVISRDNDVDRLHWLVARQHNIILRNVSLAEKMDTTLEISSICFLISRIIERIGDHVVRISQNILNLVDDKLNKEIVERIHSASELSLDIFNKSIGAFFRRDIKASNENIDSVSRLESLCEEINTLALQQIGVTAISIGYIVESIRRVGEYAEDISEIVINHLVGTEKVKVI